MESLTSMRLMDISSSSSPCISLTSGPSMSLVDIACMIEEFITFAKNFKLVEREAIKEALETGVFGDIDDGPNLYLPHPEIGSKKKLTAPIFADDD
ncbi:hypothetical protein R1sor_016889 [Riccia sorocarpa]|uniref:Uncharacterized protein n=1 Tax=Riccia sorocarpa TaxID=122646 RepID=A0ABD3HJV6_9MARC